MSDTETGPVRTDPRTLSVESPLEPDLPIIDPHHHLYKRPTATYMVESLIDDLQSGHNIVATVFVDSHAMYRRHGPRELRCIGETEFANGAAAIGASGVYGPQRICAGIVSSAPLHAGTSVREVLEKHVAAGNGRFRGIRYNTAWNADPATDMARTGRSEGLMLDAGFRQGFAELAPLGLSFDAYLYHTQIDELAALADAFSSTAVVLDHIGVPIGIGSYAGKRDAVFSAWKISLTALARRDNVHIKIGGLGMRIFGFGFNGQPLSPSSDLLAQAWRPYVETCVEAFGPARCMFESNFPVDRECCGYSVLWNAFKKITRSYSMSERALLFSETALRFYRLDLPD